MKIKNIVFDLGNVIAVFNPDSLLNGFDLSEEEKDLFKRSIFLDEKWNMCDCGAGYKETVFYDNVKKLPQKLKDVFFSLCVRHDFVYNCMKYNNEIEKVVEILKKQDYNIYLLSNIGLEFHVTWRKIPILSEFDGLFASCDYGLLKPDKAIFEKFYEVFSLNPEECIFIDDNIANVKSSEETGMKAIQYNASFEDTEVLLDRLKEIGVIAL